MSSFDPSKYLDGGEKKMHWQRFFQVLLFLLITTFGPIYAHKYLNDKTITEIEVDSTSDCPTPRALSDYFEGNQKEHIQVITNFHHPLLEKNRFYSMIRDSFYFSTDEADLFFQRRANLYRKIAVQTLESMIHFDAQSLSVFLEEEINRHPEELSSVILKDVITRSKEHIRYDCGKQQYSYMLSLAFRIDQTFPNAIKQTVSERLDKFPSIQKIKENPLNNSLEVDNILRGMAKDSVFKTDYCELVKKHENRLKIFYPTLNTNPCNLDFNSGDYQLNPVQILILQLLAQEYIQYIKNHPGRSFAIMVTGYSDSQSISGSGISYLGQGQWSPEKDSLYLGQSTGKSIEKRLTEGNHGNLQLAYARAYTGATQLSWALEQLNPDHITKYLPIWFKGIHKAQDPIKVGDRRIEFKLVEL